MARNILQTGQVYTVKVEHGLSRIESYVLKRYHPRGLFIDTVGVVWFMYFIWNHNWQMALGSFLIGRLLAQLAVIDVNAQQISETTLGKIALLHLHPINLVTQLIGFIGLLFGVWRHFPEIILGGFSVILLGHIFGWSKVDSRFAQEK